MAAGTELAIVIKAQDKASGVIGGLQRQMGGFRGAIMQHHKAIGIAMAAMGAAIVGGALMATKSYAEMGDEVAKMAKRTGFSTESLSELRHAAELSGTSLTGLEKASRFLSGTIQDAADGLTTYTRAFERIGMDYKALQGLKPEEQFLRVMESLAEVEDESIKVATAADLLGSRMGTALLPMMADGAEGLKEMRAEAYDLGIVFDKEAAASAENLKDSFTRLQASTMGVKVVIGEALMPLLMPLIEKLTSAFKWVTRWSDAHPVLSKVIAGTTLAMGALLIPLGTMLIMLPSLIAGYGLLSASIIPALIVKLKVLAATIWAAVAAKVALLALIPGWGWAALAGAAAIGTGAYYGIRRAMATPAGGGATTLNFNIDYLSGDRASADRLAQDVRESMRRAERIGTGLSSF